MADYRESCKTSSGQLRLVLVSSGEWLGGAQVPILRLEINTEKLPRSGEQATKVGITLCPRFPNGHWGDYKSRKKVKTGPTGAFRLRVRNMFQSPQCRSRQYLGSLHLLVLISITLHSPILLLLLHCHTILISKLTNDASKKAVITLFSFQILSRICISSCTFLRTTFFFLASFLTTQDAVVRKKELEGREYTVTVPSNRLLFLSEFRIECLTSALLFSRSCVFFFFLFFVASFHLYSRLFFFAVLLIKIVQQQERGGGTRGRLCTRCTHV